jgi:hypothetical protein
MEINACRKKNVLVVVDDNLVMSTAGFRFLSEAPLFSLSFSTTLPIFLLCADFTAQETIDGEESLAPEIIPPPDCSLSDCCGLFRPGGGLSLGGSW